MKEFFRFAGNLSSTPHVQDWPAVSQLKEIIGKNVVYVPGISADLNTGGFIEKYPELYIKKFTDDELLKAIKKYSYSLYPFKNAMQQGEIISKIRKIIIKQPNTEIMGEIFESWVSIEKVAKFVFNSVRVYEFWGQDWWAPFWDDEFVNYWYKIPFHLRSNQKLYKAHISMLFKEIALFNDVDPLFRDGQLSEFTFFSRIVFIKKLICNKLVALMKATLLENSKRELRIIRDLIIFRKHPLQWYGIHSNYYITKRIVNGAANICSILALDYLFQVCYSKKLENSTQFCDMGD